METSTVTNDPTLSSDLPEVEPYVYADKFEGIAFHPTPGKPQDRILGVWRDGSDYAFRVTQNDGSVVIPEFILRHPQLLATSPHAKAFRDFLTDLFPQRQSTILLKIRKIIDDNAIRPEPAPEQALPNESHTIPTPAVIQATNASNAVSEEEESPEIAEEAERILNSGDVTNEITPVLDILIAGEHDNKSLLFVLMASGKMGPKDKQIVLLKGEPGAGKTTLMEIAKAYASKFVGRFTPHALDYTDLSGYEILVIQEIGAMDKEFQGVATVKFLSADDEGYTVEVTVKDKETGRLTTETHRIPPMTVITSTTRSDIDAQFDRRSWVISPDESMEQTERVKTHRANQEHQNNLAALGLPCHATKKYALKVLRAITRRLEHKPVMLLFPRTVGKLFKSSLLRVRGDLGKIYTLIKCHAFLNQRTLPTASNGAILVTTQLVKQTLEIARPALITMTSDLEERVRILINALKDQGIVNAGDEITADHRTKLITGLHKSERTIRNYLKALVDRGHLVTVSPSAKNKPHIYQLVHSLEEIEGTYSVLVGNGYFPTDFQRQAYLEAIESENTKGFCWKNYGVDLTALCNLPETPSTNMHTPQPEFPTDPNPPKIEDRPPQSVGSPIFPTSFQQDPFLNPITSTPEVTDKTSEASPQQPVGFSPPNQTQDDTRQAQKLPRPIRSVTGTRPKGDPSPPAVSPDALSSGSAKGTSGYASTAHVMPQRFLGRASQDALRHEIVTLITDRHALSNPCPLKLLAEDMDVVRHIATLKVHVDKLCEDGIIYRDPSSKYDGDGGNYLPML